VPLTSGQLGEAVGPVERFLFFPIEVRAVKEERAMSRRPWTEDDNAKLRSLAGTMPVEDVAAELGRTPSAVVVQASKVSVSVAYKRRRRASFLDPRSAPSA
jgi:hypothetical protein